MKKDRMKEMSIEVTVGAFMFMVLLALGLFTIVLSRENLFTQTYRVEVLFEQVMGLREGDTVLMRGVAVGKVKHLAVDPEGVRLVAALDVEPKLRDNYRIRIAQSTVLGGRQMMIDEGTDDQPRIDYDGRALQGETPVNIMREATETIGMVRSALEEGRILDNLRSTMQNVSDMTERLRAGEGALGRLLTDDQLYDDLKAITASLKDVAERVQSGKGTIGKLLSEDDAVYRDLQETVANFKEVSARLERGDGVLGQLLSDEDSASRDLRETLSSVREIAARIRSGEGTLGKLVMDDALYEELSSLLTELRAGIDDSRETSPITTFSSVFFGAL
jgi:phospholipid/cholesterol/gamma-HCH transport system substrate-binding protein